MFKKINNNSDSVFEICKKAIEYNSYKILDFILKRYKKPIESAVSKYYIMLYKTCSYDKSFECLKVLVNSPIFNRKDIYEEAGFLLLVAVLYENEKIIDFLLKNKKIDPNYKNAEAFISACEKGYHNIVNLFIEDGRVKFNSDNNKALYMSISNFSENNKENYLKIYDNLLNIPSVINETNNNEFKKNIKNFLIDCIIKNKEEIFSIFFDKIIDKIGFNISMDNNDIISKSQIYAKLTGLEKLKIITSHNTFIISHKFIVNKIFSDHFYMEDAVEIIIKAKTGCETVDIKNITKIYDRLIDLGDNFDDLIDREIQKLCGGSLKKVSKGKKGIKKFF